MIYTGVDGKKSISVDYSLLKREWKLTSRKGKLIYAVPSHRSFVRIEKTDIKDIYDLRRFLSIELEEKFGQVLWDVAISEDRYCLALVKDWNPPSDAYSLEPEVFSLARLCKPLSISNCYVLDLGRNKTTLVEVRNGELTSYRISLKGGNYLTQFLASERGLSFEEAERKKLEEGLENPYISQAFINLMESLGVDLSKEKVLLSGGGSRLKGIHKHFRNVIRNSLVSPEMCTAFGASLKFLYRDCSPSFRKDEISDREFKRVLLLSGVALSLFLALNLGIDKLKGEIVRETRKAQKEAFRQEFPELPAVAVGEQLRTMVASPKYVVLPKLSLLSEKLKEGMEIYRIEFRNGRLKVVGGAKDEDLIKELGAKSLKKTPEGNYLFEVDIE